VPTISSAQPRGDTTGHRGGQGGGEPRQNLVGSFSDHSRTHWTIRTKTASTEREATYTPLYRTLRDAEIWQAAPVAGQINVVLSPRF
jgi:hypothetical protein